MSVNAAFSTAFNPSANTFFRNLQNQRPSLTADDATGGKVPDGGVERVNGALRDVDDELMDQLHELRATNSALRSQIASIEESHSAQETELREMDELMEQMHEHIRSLEAERKHLVAYANKLANDVKTVKRRQVWQKIEYDKERQQIVDELYSWKHKAQEYKAAEAEGVSAAEAKAEWECACLKQKIEELQSEVMTVQTELEETKDELSRRDVAAQRCEEDEEMIEQLRDLVVELKHENEDLQQQHEDAQRDISDLRDANFELKQKQLKDMITFEKERQELVEELLVWKNRAAEMEHMPSMGESSETPVDATPQDSVVESVDEEVIQVEEKQQPRDPLPCVCGQATKANFFEDRSRDVGRLSPDTAHNVEMEGHEENAGWSEMTDRSNNDGYHSKPTQNQSDHASATSDDEINKPECNQIDPWDTVDDKIMSISNQPEICEGDNQVESVAGQVTTTSNDARALSPSAKSDNQHDVEQHVNDQGSSTLKAVIGMFKTSAASSPASRAPSIFDEDDQDQGSSTESPLVTPRQNDSFFSRFRSFSYRARTDSMSSQDSKADVATPSNRARTSSAHIPKPKPKQKKPKPKMTHHDYLHQQEPYRMNSFKNFL